MTAHKEFLSKAGWGDAVIRPLNADASNRYYLRVTGKDRVAVLMDAAPERGEDTAPFLRIAEHLHATGLHAPQIYAKDTARGLLLLEDLGDALFARVFEADRTAEVPYYTAAIDVLIALHAAPLPKGALPDYGPETMADAARLAPIWYAGIDSAAEPVRDAMLAPLQALTWDRPALVLRDYHAENLIWIDNEKGLSRVGLLDFQDAALGHPVYDVVSLMQDARRDVSARTAKAIGAHYTAASGMNAQDFETAAAVLGAQRALRILGVFARLSLHFGKPQYVDLIPRVWGQLHQNLDHPALTGLRAVVAEHLPAPDPALLDDLRERAGTCPTL